MDDTWPAERFIDRRRVGDRRHQRLHAFLCQFFMARRVGERRRGAGDAAHYVDVHGPRALLVILVILVMCIADAYLTLTLLSDGAVEVNPVMRVLIEREWETFFYVKYAITAGGLLVLLMHKNYRLFGALSGRQILLGVLLVYAALMAYEIRLLLRHDLPLFG